MRSKDKSGDQPIAAEEFGDFSDYNVTNDTSASTIPGAQEIRSSSLLLADMPLDSYPEGMEQQCEKPGNDG